MKNTAARAGLLTLAVVAGVINGSPLVVPILGISALVLYRLVSYGASEVERALDLASADRVAQLTWHLQTLAARKRLQQRREADQVDLWVQGHPYTPAPRWPADDPDGFLADLETVLIPRVVPVPPEPEPVIHRGLQLDEVIFADGSLLAVPAALRLFRYADAP